MPFQPMPHHKLQNVRRARFSVPEPTQVHNVVSTVEPPTPRRKAWWKRQWFIWLVAFLLWLFVGTQWDVTRVIGCVILAFWFFAIGTMPHVAAWHAGVDLLNGDDD